LLRDCASIIFYLAFEHWIVLKDFFDRQLEKARNLKCQRQAGIIFPGFERIDGLARNSQVCGEFGLGSVMLGPQHFQAVFHSTLHWLTYTVVMRWLYQCPRALSRKKEPRSSSKLENLHIQADRS
jgi:hypothetical protein